MEEPNLQNASLQLEEKKLKRKKYMQEYQKKYRKERVRQEVILTLKELAIIKKSAKTHHQKVGTHLRLCALAYVNQTYMLPNEELLRELIQQVRVIGRNVNQIAYKASIHGVNSFDENNLHAQLHQLEKQVEDFIRTPLNLTNLIQEALTAQQITRVQLQSIVQNL